MTLFQAVEGRLQALRREFPTVWARLEQLLAGLEPEAARCLGALCAGLDGRDLASLPPELLLSYARASQRARETLPYAALVPEELFLRYVLPPRVNNEFPDGSRGFLYEQLAGRVRGLDMRSAALEVNWWCAEQAAYRPTDDRTIAPYGILNRAYGRCGEESTLLVSALRSVGIPARQVYAPWWAHCDDNHAWVEFWAEGQWHYTGACEPEAAPDIGWFTSAASRAMLVRAFAPVLEHGGWELLNATARYGDTAPLTVRVTRAGAPQAGVKVAFGLVNDSQLRPLWEGTADENGTVCLEVGLGCLVVSACFGGRLVEQSVDVRDTRRAELRWEDGFDPLTQERTDHWELLVPPREKLPPVPPEDAAHQARLVPCQAAQRKREASFAQEDSPWLRLAGGNRGEITRFLTLPGYAQEDKELLLSTLAEKDFADVTCTALEDALAAALPWKGRFPLKVWRDELLAPRVEHEPLLSVRRELQALLAGEGLTGAGDVLAWMDAHLRPLEEHGRTDRRGNAAAYVRQGVCPPSERDILAVQICRALGIPARLELITNRFFTHKNNDKYSTVSLTLVSEGEELRYWEHFTLARWTGDEYEVLHLNGLSVSGKTELSLAPGAYSLVTCRRQIDGTASAKAERFLLRADQARTVCLPPDRTRALLQSVSLPSVKLYPLTGVAPELAAAPGAGGGLLLFLQPGSEPTEHLLQELLELEVAYRQGGWPIRSLLSRKEDLENETLRRVLAALPESGCFLYRSPDRYQIQHAMGLGDARLPLAVALDKNGRGVYASANYSIRTAHTLLRILQML